MEKPVSRRSFVYTLFTDKPIDLMFTNTTLTPKPWQEENVDVLDATQDAEEHDLVVFNDEVNTFDHVIDTLIDVCEHTPEQAEQCTLIIHFKGKCSVKKGDFDRLAPMRNAICGRGISAEVL